MPVTVHPTRGPSILLRVAPQVLDDVLCAALRGAGMHVDRFADVALDGHSPVGVYDVALVSEGLSEGIEADTVLTLDATGTSLEVAWATHRLTLDSEDNLLELIRLIRVVFPDQGGPGTWSRPEDRT